MEIASFPIPWRIYASKRNQSLGNRRYLTATPWRSRESFNNAYRDWIEEDGAQGAPLMHLLSRQIASFWNKLFESLDPLWAKKKIRDLPNLSDFFDFLVVPWNGQLHASRLVYACSSIQ